MQSVILRKLRGLPAAVDNSLLARKFSVFLAWLYRLAENSALLSPLFRTTKLTTLSNNSALRHAMTKIADVTVFLGRFVGESFRQSKLATPLVWLLNRPGYVVGMMLLGFVSVPNDMWNNAYNTILAGLLLTFALLRAIVLSKPFIKKGVLPLSLVVFMAIVLLSQLLSQDFSLTLRFFIFYVTAFMFTIAILSLIDNAQALKQTVTLWLIGIFFTGLYGVWQNISGAVKIDPTLTDMAVSGDMPGRIYATFGNANNYAELLLLTLPLFIGMMLIVKKFPAKLAFFLMLLPPVASMFLTGSRSAWVSVLFSIVLFVLLTKPKWLPYLIVAGLCAIPLLPGYFINRFLSLFGGNDSSSRYRQTIFRTVSPLTKSVWFEGVGVGPQIFTETTLNFPIYTINVMPHVHRTIYQVLLEFGVFGCLSIILTVFGSFAMAIRRIFAFLKTPYGILLAAFLSSLAGLTLMSIGEHVWFYPRMMACFFISLALMLSLIHMDPAEMNEEL